MLPCLLYAFDCCECFQLSCPRWCSAYKLLPGSGGSAAAAAAPGSSAAVLPGSARPIRLRKALTLTPQETATSQFLHARPALGRNKSDASGMRPGQTPSRLRWAYRRCFSWKGATDASARAGMHRVVLSAVRSHEVDRAIVEAGLLLLATTATNAVTKSIMVSDDRARLFSSPPDPQASSLRVVTAALRLARQANSQSPVIARVAFQLIANTFDPEQEQELELPWEGRWRMSGLVAAMTTAMQQHASDADLLLLGLHAIEHFASLYGWGNCWMINEAAQSAGLPAAITAAATLHGRCPVVAREATRVQRLLQRAGVTSSARSSFVITLASRCAASPSAAMRTQRTAVSPSNPPL